MPLGIARRDLVEFPEQLLLAFSQLHRCLDDDVNHQIARGMAADIADAFAPEAEDLGALRLRGNPYVGGAVEGGDLDFAAQGCGGETDWHLAMQVVTIALEDGVLLDVNLHVEIPRRPTVDTGFAMAAMTQAHAVIDPRRNLHFEGLLPLDAPRAAAGGAGLRNDAAAAMAFGAGLLDGEEPLLYTNLPRSATSWAGLRLGAGFCAAAVAGVAFFQCRNADGLLGAASGFLQRDLEVVAQVGASIDIRAASTPSAASKDVAKDISEGIGKAVEALAASTAAAHGRVDASMAVAVVGGALVGIGQDLIGFLGLLELVLSVLAVRVAVRMIFHGQLAVGLFQLVLRGVAIDAEDLV